MTWTRRSLNDNIDLWANHRTFCPTFNSFPKYRAAWQISSKMIITQEKGPKGMNSFLTCYVSYVNVYILVQYQLILYKILTK
jgi:hypothetical protein